MKYRKNPTPMFAEFHNAKEYRDAFKSVMDNTKKGKHVELVVFIERLRTTLMTEMKGE